MVLVGTDIIDIPRVKKLLKVAGDGVLSKYLIDSEIALVTSPHTAAGFFAVKEAVAKAFGVGFSDELSVFDILISKTGRGAPVVTLTPEKISHFKVESITVSISHTDKIAMAVAIVHVD